MAIERPLDERTSGLPGRTAHGIGALDEVGNPFAGRGGLFCNGFGTGERLLSGGRGARPRADVLGER